MVTTAKRRVAQDCQRRISAKSEEVVGMCRLAFQELLRRQRSKSLLGDFGSASGQSRDSSIVRSSLFGSRSTP